MYGITSISHSAISVEADHDSCVACRSLMHNDLNLEFREHGTFSVLDKNRRNEKRRKKCAILMPRF